MKKITNMLRCITVVLIVILWSAISFAQKSKSTGFPNSIAPVGIINNLSDSALLEVVERQTFRFFWHDAHPVSGLALERSNTVLAEHYWDYINEAWDEPNFSKTKFGPDACAIGGTGFGIMSTIIAVERKWIGRDTAVRRLIKIADFLINADCLSWDISSFHEWKNRQDNKI